MEQHVAAEMKQGRIESLYPTINAINQLRSTENNRGN